MLARTAALGAVLLAGAAHAQALPAGVQLGMTELELQRVLPALERVARPPRLPGGLAGHWRAAPLTVAGLALEPTYFFAGTALKRVEFVAVAPIDPAMAASAYEALVAWGRSTFGPELASSDPGSEMAAWAQGDTDIYVQRVADARRGSVRLVYKMRQLKDASQL